MKDTKMVKKRPVTAEGKLRSGPERIGPRWTRYRPRPAQTPGRLAQVIEAAERKFEVVNPAACILEFLQAPEMCPARLKRLESVAHTCFQWRRDDDVRITWAAPVSGVSLRSAGCTSTDTVSIVVVEGNPGTTRYFEAVFWVTSGVNPVVSPMWLCWE